MSFLRRDAAFELGPLGGSTAPGTRSGTGQDVPLVLLIEHRSFDIENDGSVGSDMHTVNGGG
ncbi:hypothetical protein Sm713_76950 [Streptomyces sp. TS71-3]|nr:hypothetical protein Sm713_76950 [Streptomyces sp. TS71-3]